MQQLFTPEFMLANKGCYTTPQLFEAFPALEHGEDISLDDILVASIPLGDKFWFAIRKVLNPIDGRNLAIDVVEAVLPIFESRYPKETAPREAVQAAREFTKGFISTDVLRQKGSAALRSYWAVLGGFDTIAQAAYLLTVETPLGGSLAQAASIAADVAASSRSKNELLTYLMLECFKPKE